MLNTTTETNPAISALAPSENRPAPRLHFIDGLRGLAMLMVLLFHGWVYNGYWHLYLPLGSHHKVNLTAPLAFGYTGVHLFLVLSGFCLYWPFVKGGTRREPTLWEFAKKRCRRILPPYYVALALFGGWALVQSVLPVRLAAPPVFSTGYVLDWLWLHAAMLHNLYPGYILTIDPPLWTLALEFQLYILFPLLVEAYRRFPARLVLLAVFAWTILFRFCTAHAVLLPNNDYESVITNSVFGRCFEFALGMYAAKVVAEWHRDGKSPLRLADSGILIAFFLVTAVDHRFWHFGITADAKWGLIYAGLLLAASQPKSRLHHWLSARWLVACGIFSYSVYLIHEPLMIAFRRYVVTQPLPNPANAGLELGIMVPLMLLLGYGFHRLFERPFMNTPRPAAGTGV